MPGPSGFALTPEPVEIIGAAVDAHTSLVSTILGVSITGQSGSGTTADELIARMDEANIQSAIVQSHGYNAQLLTDDNNISSENNFISDEVSKFSDRLLGLCGINPLRLSASGEIERCLARPGMVGVALHLSDSRVDMTNPQHVTAMTRVFDAIERLDVPVLLDSGTQSGLPLNAVGLENLVGVIRAHPDARVLHARCTGLSEESIDTWLSVFDSDLDVEPENQFVETSTCLNFYRDAPLAQRELVVWRLRKWGMERVLFGSGYLRIQHVETPEEALETLAAYPFTQEEIDLITGNDASAWLEGQ